MQDIRLIALLLLFFYSGKALTIELNPVLQKITALEEKSVHLSPELKIVRNFRSQKGAESYTRFSDFLPQANFVIRKERDFYEERNAQLRALGIGVLNSTWGIDYRWILLNYGLLQANCKTYTEKEKAELEVENKAHEFPITFKTNLLNLLLAQYKKAAVLNSIKKAETGKKEARLGFELGQKTKLDVLRSEANMVSLEAKKITFTDEEQNARSVLLEYSGLEIADLGFLQNLEEDQITQLINVLSAPADNRAEPAFDKSPLLQSLAYEEKINTINLAGLTQSQWPELKIQGSYNNAGDSFSQSTHNPYRTHSVALILTIPLFGGGNLISSNFESYFAKKQIEYSMAQRKLETQNRLSNTLLKIKALDALVNSLSLNVSQFEELYRLTSKSYQLGKSTLIELLEVQDNLLDSKISLAQNKIQFFTLSQNYLWQAGLQ